MKRFYIKSQPFLTIYMSVIVILVVLNLLYHHTFVVGVLIGTLASMVNTTIFEYYLWRAQHRPSAPVSTGNGWRYLVAIVACTIWFFNQSAIHIVGVLIGLMISYALIIFRPLFKRG
ncbi:MULTISPECIES: ATP synthase subunit I [unclassified Staphylococcus]|uniref:ATP synthase subunit I n=1 Tax=unclassified Staphylococcus TaxID=91994 RepID=UPI0021D2AF25|nr:MULTISPECIES: ATP synthase subunit I [unclassified Staphylococcus]UXR69141.1 ATP synthase subunit I [Staphylococcus sp. IVB6246]UXR71195.1 ATP synthase subunit I [Staphylococcus sp. IVB6240]UXR73468.1 ATP synthase subunit I [Staphylococcus sp. IVB6238]UXR75785.1 ATP synthase subunit I [Staphylococcus sp. IVB6233]UXR79984.1 ATP synthase subunit I [Staphylococcus sp. IVB6218]